MKHFFVLTILFLLFSASYGQAGGPQTTSQKFMSGGTVRLHLEAGEYTIRPSDAENIVVTCHSSSERLKEVKVEIKLVEYAFPMSAMTRDDGDDGDDGDC